MEIAQHCLLYYAAKILSFIKQNQKFNQKCNIHIYFLIFPSSSFSTCVPPLLYLGSQRHLLMLKPLQIGNPSHFTTKGQDIVWPLKKDFCASPSCDLQSSPLSLLNSRVIKGKRKVLVLSSTLNCTQ